MQGQNTSTVRLSALSALHPQQCPTTTSAVCHLVCGNSHTTGRPCYPDAFPNRWTFARTNSTFHSTQSAAPPQLPPHVRPAPLPMGHDCSTLRYEGDLEALMPKPSHWKCNACTQSKEKAAVERSALQSLWASMGRSGGALSGRHDRNLALRACVDVLQAMSEAPTLSQLRSGSWRFLRAPHSFEERKYDSLPPLNRLSLVLREGPQKNLVQSTDSSEVPPKSNFLLVLHSLPVFQIDCPQHMQCWSIPSPIPPLCLEACVVSHGTLDSSWTDTIQVQWLLAKHNHHSDRTNMKCCIRMHEDISWYFRIHIHDFMYVSIWAVALFNRKPKGRMKDGPPRRRFVVLLLSTSFQSWRMLTNIMDPKT